MKFVGVREAQARLSGIVEESQQERIVLTRHGRPIAVLTGVENQDLESVLLSQDLGFRNLIADRRKHRGELIAHDALRARIAPPRAATARKGRKRSRR